MSYNLPPSWFRMSFTAKAAYLCATKHARDYSHACSMLAQRKKRPAIETRRVSVETYQATLEKRGLA